jgi:hypothetical protein
MLIGHNPNAAAADPGERGDQRLPEICLVLLHRISIRETTDDAPHIIFGSAVCTDDAVQVFTVLHRLTDLTERKSGTSRELCDESAHPVESGFIVRLMKVGSAADSGMHRRAAELLRIGHLTDGRLHERRTRKVHLTPLRHDEHVAENRKVSSASDAIPHHARKLRNAFR